MYKPWTIILWVQFINLRCKNGRPVYSIDFWSSEGWTRELTRSISFPNKKEALECVRKNRLSRFQDVEVIENFGACQIVKDEDVDAIRAGF